MKKVDILIRKLEKYKNEKSNKMRSEKELKEMIQKYEDIIWANEFTKDEYNKSENKSTAYVHSIWEKSDKLKELTKKYKKEELFPDNEGTFLAYGILIALKWVYGDKMYNRNNFGNVILNKYKGVN